MSSPGKATRQRNSTTSEHGRQPLWLLLPLVFAAIVLSHWTLLRLPYFWDEGGYYIPSALDLFRTGTLIPHSTVTNAHPPLPAVLLAGWWQLFGFHILATRLLTSLVAAFALVAVFRLTRSLLDCTAAAAVTLLTALYPIWFVQSTLAHADLFAAAFTLWALAVYFEPAAGISTAAAGIPTAAAGASKPAAGASKPADRNAEAEATSPRRHLQLALLFTSAALAKETAIVTPVALAGWELLLTIKARRHAEPRTAIPHPTHSAQKIAALLFPILPLAAWYAYHRARTGFIFGNPEFLRYNATANLDAYRVLLSFWHRVIHLTLHMNMFVPVLATVAILFVPRATAHVATRRQLTRHTLQTIAVILVANALAFSILGGALLTRYLLPMYPLVLLLSVHEWQRRLAHWQALTALSAVAFITALFINPPYAFAPEDNLTYRDMIVLHQRAIHIIDTRFPAATVLTAWPAAAELQRPELGYTDHEVKFFAVPNFSRTNIQKAAESPGDYDTALLFSTKWAPPANRLDLSRNNRHNDEKYFDFHTDLSPQEAALILHGEVIWQAAQGGEWVAILRFPRTFSASR